MYIVYNNIFERIIFLFQGWYKKSNYNTDNRQRKLITEITDKTDSYFDGSIN